MSKHIVIIGAGGHGKVVADLALKCGYSNISFADDNVKGECMGYPIVCKCDEIESLFDEDTDFVIAVGNNSVRRSISERLNVRWATLIHPSAQIGCNVTVGVGTVVIANAVVNPCAVIGKHCIVNTGAVVEHDDCLADYVHVSPHVAIGGSAKIGMETHVGIGATVINNVEICEKCVIGAGAAVVNNITDSGVYIGVPAKKMEDR